MRGRRLETVAVFSPLVVLVGLPLVVSPRSDVPVSDDARRLTILTPHNELIRWEFQRAFEAWHLDEYGEPVEVVWSVPGGTSVIRRLLSSQFTAALVDGDPPGGNADMVFGGGTYEHGRFARELTVKVGDETRRTTISVPIDFDDAWLQSVYGENNIGTAKLYDDDKHWFGLAVSGFGIVYNRDALEVVGVAEPRSWKDLTRPELFGWVALADPTLSGSTATVLETVLQRRGWLDGLAVLRRAGANARFFAATSLKPPLEVSRGDAAVGMCIDFLGRSQAQALVRAGGPDRVGYLDPPGETSIDPDPISMLRGAPEPELAKRFVQFCLTDIGQSLWQFRADDPVDDGLGPYEYELRRMPILRSFYMRHFDRLIDRVNPYDLVNDAPLDPNMRQFVGPLFGAMCIDTHEELQAAWTAIISHPAWPDTGDPQLARMLEEFDRLPQAPDGEGVMRSLSETESLAAIAAGWRNADLWPAEGDPRAVARYRFADFFREQYDAVLAIAAEGPS